MKTTTFTEFRKKAAAYINDVEKGETVRILRHGKPVADIVPIVYDGEVSWKQSALRLIVNGASLSRTILEERQDLKQ